MAPVLDLEIVSSNLMESHYPDIVSQSQIGLNTFSMREAMQLFMDKNKQVFERLELAGRKFQELKK